MIGQWKGKVGLEVLERKGKRTEERKLEEDETDSHGLQRLQVTRDLIAGEKINVVLDLTDMGIYLINSVTEVCGFPQVYLG